MGSALTNGSSPTLLNRKPQINHPNSELPNINGFIEDRRDIHLICAPHAVLIAWNLLQILHPLLTKNYRPGFCFSVVWEERRDMGSPKGSAKTNWLSQILKLADRGILKKILIPNTTLEIQKMRNISESVITSSMETKNH